jgi:hypothetical protein
MKSPDVLSSKTKKALTVLLHQYIARLDNDMNDEQICMVSANIFQAASTIRFINELNNYDYVNN